MNRFKKNLEKRDWWVLLSNFSEKFIKGETLSIAVKNENNLFMGNMIVYLNETDCAANFRNFIIKNEKDLISKAIFKRTEYNSFLFEKEGQKLLITNEEELQEKKEYEFGDIVFLKDNEENSSLHIFYANYVRFIDNSFNNSIIYLILFLYSREKSVKIGEIKNFLGAEILGLQLGKMIVHEASTQRKKYLFNLLKLYVGSSLFFMIYSLFFKLDNFKSPLRL